MNVPSWLSDKLNLNNVEQSLASVAQQLGALESGLSTGALSITWLPVTSSDFDTAQVSVSTSPTLIAAANASRRYLRIMNGSGAAIYLGGSTVAASSGYEVPVSTVFDMGSNGTPVSTAAIYGITAASSSTVSVLEF